MQKTDDILVSCMVCAVWGKARCSAWKICVVSSTSKRYWPAASWPCYGICNRGCNCTMVSLLL